MEKEYTPSVEQIIKRVSIDKLDDITVYIYNGHFSFMYTLADSVLKDEFKGKYEYVGGLQCNYENDSEMLARVTRLGEDYIGRMRELARLGMFSSVRLHEDGEKPPNRRCSFCIDQEVIASAKTTKTSSKNNPRGCMCAGHIPRDNYLRKYKYSYTDNNNPGDYPALIRNETPNSELLCQLRADYTKAESETHIIEAKMFHKIGRAHV